MLPGCCVRGGVSAGEALPSLHPDSPEALVTTPAPPPIFLPLCPWPFPESSPTCPPAAASAPALPTKAGAWLLLPYPRFLLSLRCSLSLPLPADRVRQVRPVLRAPGPPSTSNQIPPLPRRPPFPSPPGQLFCDFMVAPQPQSLPFFCDFLWCGELTPPGVTLVKFVSLCGPAPALIYKYL